MATTTLFPALQHAIEAKRPPLKNHLNSGLLLVTFLTLIAVAIGGYHPFSEDGGLYTAGIKQVLNPMLYPHGSEFVEGHLPYSLFVPGIAWLTSSTKLNLPVVLLTLHLATWWLTLFAGWMLACRCFNNLGARCGAVGLLAVWLTLPIAGTSLMLMDPYLTARSVSTPCGLLALAGALDFRRPGSLDFRRPGSLSAVKFRGLLLCFGSLLFGCAVHLLMGMYSVCVMLLLLAFLSTRSYFRALLLCLTALAFLSLIQCIAPAESPGYLQSAFTRSYWFITRWEWYEQFGLVAPLAILAFTLTRTSKSHDRNLTALIQTALAAGTTAVIAAFIFTRPALSSLLIARLQPLRIFQFVYVVMILVLGAWLGDCILRASWVRWVCAFTLLGGAMLYAQRQIYPSSNHLEFPDTSPKNLWVQSFLWIKANTPVDATFAIDAHYIGAPGEDAQTFRAIAERSVLPDYSKDGGEASISPAMSAAWIRGVEAQTDLGQQSDIQRLEHLRPLGVSWLVLKQSDATNFPCPYSNTRVKVCQLR